MPTCDNCGENHSKDVNYCPRCAEPVGDGVSEYAKTTATRGSDTGDLDITQVLELVDREELIETRRPSYLNWYRQFLGAGVIFLFCLFAAISLGNLIEGVGLMFLGLVIAAVIVAYVWRARQRLLFVFTNRRFIRVYLSTPVIESLVGVSARRSSETWIDEINGMEIGESFMERLISSATGGTMGHIKLYTGQGNLFTKAGLDLRMYNHEDCSRAVRNARNKTVYKHTDIVSALTDSEAVSMSSEQED